MNEIKLDTIYFVNTQFWNYFAWFISAF